MVAVVRKRACCEFSSCMEETDREKGLEEEVVDLFGDESEHWCEVSVCACFCSYL